MSKLFRTFVVFGLLGGMSVGCTTTTRTSVRRNKVLPTAKRDQIRVHFVDIGVGACHLVECPGRNAPVMLVDCGSTREPEGLSLDDAEDEVQRYVSRVIGKKKVIVVLSHPDKDHYHYVPMVLKSKSIQSVWLGMKERNYRKLRRFFNGLDRSVKIYDQRDLYRDFHKVNPETKKPLMCGKAQWFILAVNEGTKRRRVNKNEASLVLMVKYKRFSAIFPGDAFGSTEKAAILNAKDAGIKLSGVTVLSASHHGAHTHKSNRWLRKLKPKIMVYPSGDSYGHPSCRIMKDGRAGLLTSQEHTIRCAWSSKQEYRVKPSALAEYVTATNGNVVISSDGVSKPKVHCTTHPKLRAKKSLSCGLR